MLCFSALVGAVPAFPGFDRMQQIAAQRYGQSAVKAVLAWRQLLDDLQQEGHSVEDKLSRVNAFFNARLRFDDDIAVWRVADYWATPLEALARAAGDCEDFAIAKYMTLRLLGIDDSRLRLIYVRARIGGPDSQVSQAHMVLGYYPEPSAEPLILDNLIRDIRPAARRPDLFPVFSFNADGLWVAGALQPSAAPGARLSRWRDVLDRARAEGLVLPGKQP
ncbi:transglutaminase-like cysteine peptidase [Thauera butanivorans]|jgi:predicted transglutaminase-like cysteine proteinase|uniref:transglutaminase-like cysteine peptidase n=1 Tax=Thauera butanivorans TaxID=86174 RepID=UPI000ABF22F2|nr:transglutaminase-like cysteine peptidase [Thauera butanivorans]